MNRFKASVLFATAALLVAAAPPSFEQVADPVPPPQAPAGWKAPHTPWGDPDLRGIWPLDLGRTPMQRSPQYGDHASFTDEEFKKATDAATDASKNADREDAVNKLGPGNWFEYGRSLRQTSLITEPADGRIPEMTPLGKERAAHMLSSWTPGLKFNSIADFNSLDRCITRGLPASMIPFPYNNGVQIFQSPGYVVINLELIHERRIIPLGKVPQLPGQLRPWLGSSRGHFEGDTLVVETANFNGDTPMVIVGPSNQPVPTSKSMRIVEHFTPKGPDTLYYEAWLSDPEVLTAPFKMAFPLTRNESYEPYEYACHEGNTLIRGYITATSPRFAEWRKARGGKE
jgi:hypothetical protein